MTPASPDVEENDPFTDEVMLILEETQVVATTEREEDNVVETAMQEFSDRLGETPDANLEELANEVRDDIIDSW